MPGEDRTGPWGEGPMTGRGAGRCSGSSAPGMTNYRGWGPGRGFGKKNYGRPRFGLGSFGRGRRWSFRDHPEDLPQNDPYLKEPAKDEEKRYLEGVIKDLEAELEEIKGRLKELEK
jgi:hypothetical protein